MRERMGGLGAAGQLDSVDSSQCGVDAGGSPRLPYGPAKATPQPHLPCLARINKLVLYVAL